MAMSDCSCCWETPCRNPQGLGWRDYDTELMKDILVSIIAELSRRDQWPLESNIALNEWKHLGSANEDD